MKVGEKLYFVDQSLWSSVKRKEDRLPRWIVDTDTRPQRSTCLLRMFGEKFYFNFTSKPKQNRVRMLSQALSPTISPSGNPT